MSGSRRLYDFGPFRLDADEGMLLRDGRQVPLKPKVLETLVALVEHGTHVVDKTALMQRLWPDTFVEEANLAVNISQLRKALGHDEQGVRYIETVPKRGYRFVAPVNLVVVEDGDVVIHERTRSRIVVDETEVEPALGATVEVARRLAAHQPPRTRRGAAAAVLLVVGAAAALVAVRHEWSPSASARPLSIAVLPFRNLKPDPESDFLGAALADAITTRLGNVGPLVVRPSARVDPNRPIELQRLAKALDVNTLLTGSYIRDRDDLRISAELVDVGRNEIVWQETMDVKYLRLLDVQDRIAYRIVDGLHLKISPTDRQRMTLDAPQNPLAYESYLRGRHLISSNDHPSAIRMLEESVRLDPTYALAWAFLGKAYSVEASQFFGGAPFIQKAHAAYDRALALNPSQYEARILLANFLTENNRVEEAVPILRQVIEANPNHSYARWELSYAYRYGGLLDESIDEGELALKLDPNLTAHLFNSYLYSGQYEKFLGSLPRRDEAYIIFYRGLGHYYLDDYARAATEFDRAHQLDPASIISHLGRALSLGIAGKSRDGVGILQAAERKTQDGANDGEISYKLAQAYAVLGERPSALRLLKRAVEQGFFCYPYFTADPLLANLRGDAAYTTVVEQAHQRHQAFRRRFS